MANKNRKVVRWITINGRHVPIFDEDYESNPTKQAVSRQIINDLDDRIRQIEENKKVADQLNYSVQNHYQFVLKCMEDNIRDEKNESLVVIGRDGSILLDKTDNKPDRVVITEEEKELMKDATITHNHPTGSTFSWQDLKTLEDTEAHEIRAVGSNGITYSLVRGDNVTSNGDFFYNYYADEATYKINTVDKIWNNSAQTQVDAYRCNKMLEDYRKQWLKDNSKKYGYKYSERRVKV